MTNSYTHGRANQHINAASYQKPDDALRTFPFRSGTSDDPLPDAPVFGMFEQVINPLALDGLRDSTPTWQRHDDNNVAEGDMSDNDNDVTIATMASQPTDSNACTSSDTPASSETQSGQYGSMAYTQADLHENGMRLEGRTQVSDVNIDGCQTDCGVSMKHSPSSPEDSNNDAVDTRQLLNGDALIAPNCDEIMRAVVDAYAAHGDGIGNAYARAVGDAMGWCDSNMSTALAFSKHVDVVRTAGIIGRNAVDAVSGLWDIDGGIGGMLASTQGYITGLMPYDNRRSVVYDGRDVGYGSTDHRDAMHETGISSFQRRLIGIIDMLGNTAGRRSVCTVSFPICYSDRPLLVPLCDGDYDAREWLDRQYWRKIPMHLGEDGRMHEDAWLTSRETLPGDGTSAIAVRRNGELVPQWCAWTEDLHVAGLALGMLHDVLAERSGLLSLSIAERDGGDLVGTVRKVWEWCAAYAWYL